ncbi:hypothetical protein EYC84_009195 [Monilinia fructicola]|uniref:Uncharacterized protein n=1 Tax=Monilinia fructicola TaxID=38448 RepID=A0A5M9JD33_MONFR|nr:hypothetical protein EYC84_009195 [Monilinia fructicola]
MSSPPTPMDIKYHQPGDSCSLHRIFLLSPDTLPISLPLDIQSTLSLSVQDERSTFQDCKYNHFATDVLEVENVRAGSRRSREWLPSEYQYRLDNFDSDNNIFTIISASLVHIRQRTSMSTMSTI